MNVFVVILDIGGQVKHIACWDASHIVLLFTMQFGKCSRLFWFPSIKSTVHTAY